MPKKNEHPQGGCDSSKRDGLLLSHPRLVSLIRVSTPKQSKNEIGIEAQRAANQKFAALNKANIYEVVEVGSGKRPLDQRPELRHAVEIAKQTGAPLLVDRLDRLGRNRQVIEEIAMQGVEIITAEAAGPLNDDARQIQAAKAQRVGEMLSERSRDGLRRARAAGVQLGSPDPWKGGQIRGQQISTDAADFAREIHQHIAKIKARAGRMSYKQIADALNVLGVQTRQGGSWGATQVKRVLERMKDLGD
jgi:DNA invertase Pin-like site-specific DNA recombinase